MTLDLTSSRQFREPIGTSQNNEIPAVPATTPEPVPNRSRNSSTIPQFPSVPLTGGEITGTASLDPHRSSAAPQLRSQRTERCGGEPAGPTLRPYQESAIDAVESEFARGIKRTLLVLPTGTGKTVVFAELARRDVALGDHVLILAHRSELIDQAVKKLADVGVLASVEQGDRRGSLRSPVVVASVQSLRGKRLERYPRDFFRKIVVDEAHHAAAKSYGNVLEHFPEALVLGVTATPDRGDGRALGKLFESVAFTYEMRAAIRDKYLAKLTARRVLVKDLDLSSVRSHHGDFDQADLSKLLATEKALHGVVSPMLEMAGDRRTLVFGVDVAHAHAIAEVINRHKPASAIAVDGSASADERAAALSLFRQGTFQFLVNCALFTEGFDEPSITCIALARPTQSRALYTQMLGRGTRLLGNTLEESIANGKADCLVLDFVGNSRHRLIGPADALGGTLDETTREEVERRLAEDQSEDLDALLEAAELAAQRHLSKTALVALALYRTKEIDPFLGDFVKPLDLNSPGAKEPATEARLSAIKKLKLSDPPGGFTKGEASQLLDAVKARQKAGLASIPQARLLSRLGLDTREMTFARANQLCTMGATRGWKPYTFMHEPEFKRGKVDKYPLRTPGGRL
jgi:superfamily II DNA or RNA helicase